MEAGIEPDLSIERPLINSGRVLHLSNPAPHLNDPSLVTADIAENAGTALVRLDVQLANGLLFNLLSPRCPSNSFCPLFDLAPRSTEWVAPWILQSTFSSEIQRGFWTGPSDITVTQGFHRNGFELVLQSKNVGETPVLFGTGARLYFVAPSGDPSAIRIRLPARKFVEIDNDRNALPTGRILDIAPGSHYDFNRAEGVPLNRRYFDNLFVDLEGDSDGYAFTEFIDTKAKLRVRMTALTKNVIGVQMYAPPPGAERSDGVFAALELVTHLPDPREELWGATPTGMQLLQPGETGVYGYRIDVHALC